MLKGISIPQQQSDISKENIEFVKSDNILSTGSPNLKVEQESQIKKIWELIKHGVHETWVGTKKTYNDYKFTKSLLKNKQIYSENYTAQELQRIKRIKKDAFKLVPFSVFLIIPFLEAFIPFYLLIFPNALPSNYIPKDKNEQSLQNKLKKQEIANKQLLMGLKSFLINEGVQVTDLALQQNLRIKVEQYEKQIEQNYNFKNMTSDQLIQICDYLLMDYITGTHLINTLFRHSVNFPKYIANILLFIIRAKKRVQFNHWFFNKKFKLNFGPFEILKRKLLLYQLQVHIKQLRAEDHALTKFGFDKQIIGYQDLAQGRGISETENSEIKEFFEEYWLPKTDNIRLTKNQYIIYALLNYQSDIKVYETF